MLISPSRFRLAYNRFQSLFEDRYDKKLVSFQDPDTTLASQENYKNWLPGQAQDILKAHSWSRKNIGDGNILARVIQAIEIPGNNLLQWQARNGPKSRVHSNLLKIKRHSAKCREIETCFYQLYKNRTTDSSLFERIIEVSGRRYELLAYLFFIAAPHQFLPIRTKSFDKAFAELGVEHRTANRCDWDNYQTFIKIIKSVQKQLQAEGIEDATLLDAHSFCWILSRKDSARREFKVPALMAFQGRILAHKPNGTFSVKEDAEIRDMQQEMIKRNAAGQIAEEAALKAERRRLQKAGRSDLAEKVQSVADKPGLGYDIQSFELDGSERFIEVKNVSQGNRFFISESEWLNSRNRSNYFFYLVQGIERERPLVTIMSAVELEYHHLCPTQYVVRYRSK
jgi:hypothetical protein